MTYLLVNIFSIAVPFIYSFHKQLNFYKQWYAFWPATLVTTGFFVAWDIYFTKIGVWGFNPKHVTEFYFLGLPIEEWLFFICIPYACVFTYFCFKVLIKKDYFQKFSGFVTYALAIILLTVAVFNTTKIYTSTTFFLLALFLTLLKVFEVPYLGRFYFTYLVILIPFFIVNGLLTGSVINEPVVWYNNNQNLGIRLFTIPVEDVFYGMLLILMNVAIYEAIVTKFGGGRDVAV